MTAIGSEPSESIWDASAKAATTSRCSPFPVGANVPVQSPRSIAAASEPSSATAHRAAGQVVGEASMRTSPVTSSANSEANVTASAPPKEWPTTTYGPGSPIVSSSSCRSVAWVVNVAVEAAGSLVPVPGRS